MRVRRTLPPIVLVAALALPAVPASAGGWDSLTFPKRHYVVGEVASTRDRFFAGALEGSGSLDAGPYHAYLLTATRDEGFGMIDPPAVPSTAIRIGTLSLTGPFRVPRFGGPQGRATLSFVVPDVPTGLYAIGFCDDPCVHATVGWLAWGLISIVHTPYEAVLLDRVQRESRAADALAVVLRKAERKAEDLRARLDALTARLRADRAEATTPIEVAGAGPVVDVAPEGDPSVTWWIVGVAGLAALAAGIALGRRRTETPFVLRGAIPGRS